VGGTVLGLWKTIPASSKGIGSDIFRSPRLKAAPVFARDRDPDRLALWFGEGIMESPGTRIISTASTKGRISALHD
jgi:hypothetical protein